MCPNRIYQGHPPDLCFHSLLLTKEKWSWSLRDRSLHCQCRPTDRFSHHSYWVLRWINALGAKWTLLRAGSKWRSLRKRKVSNHRKLELKGSNWTSMTVRLLRGISSTKIMSLTFQVRFLNLLTIDSHLVTSKIQLSACVTKTTRIKKSLLWKLLTITPGICLIIQIKT